MRASSVLVLCLYLAAAHASSLFMWSNTKLFNGKNIEVSEAISTDALKSALNGEGPLAKYMGDHTSTESIVVFVEPEHTQQIPTLNTNSLKDSLTSSASSLSLQEVSSQASGSALVLFLMKNLPSGATVTIARNSGSKLLANLEGRPDIKFVTHEELKHGQKSNLVVVVLDQPSTDAITSVLQSVRGNYLAMLTTAKPEAAKAHVQEAVQEVGAINDGTSWDSELIEAVIVMIPFVAILLTGICCTFSVQSGLKFDGERKKR